MYVLRGEVKLREEKDGIKGKVFGIRTREFSLGIIILLKQKLKSGASLSDHIF
jgi:hypothetical protein